MTTKIIQSSLFKKFPELVFGFSTKTGGESPDPYGLNLSFTVGDDPESVKRNRKIFFEQLGIKEDQVTFQKQIHSTIINHSKNLSILTAVMQFTQIKKITFLQLVLLTAYRFFYMNQRKK
ncbi:MAG: laccase domain-containing protein [Ignavibacteria bacterium]|nr:laccase domain-containing protein [Ignavibacteria bacterium]